MPSSDIAIGRRAIRRSALIFPKLKPTSSLTSRRRSLFSTRSAIACHASLAARSRRTLALVRRAKVPLGLRWPVERTNSWLSNYGQMRRNADRCSAHRVAQTALVMR